MHEAPHNMPIPAAAGNALTVAAIIPISTGAIDGATVQTVNARDLHAFLENGDHFATWVKARIEKFGFVENQDFVTFSESTEKGRPRLDYHVSLDMAKELAMVENNDKGKQARRYFIECERIAKAGPTLPDLSDPVVLVQLLTEHASKRIEAERRADVAERKVEAVTETVAAFDRIATSDGGLCITDAAKALQVRPKDLFAWLRAHAWIYSRPGRSGDVAYQDKIQSGHLEHKVTTVSRSDGTEKTVEQVRVTPKGLARLAKIVPGASIQPEGGPA